MKMGRSSESLTALRSVLRVLVGVLCLGPLAVAQDNTCLYRVCPNGNAAQECCPGSDCVTVDIINGVPYNVCICKQAGEPCQPYKGCCPGLTCVPSYPGAPLSQ